MRPIDPETGKPYRRKRPVNWQDIKHVLRHRQAHVRIIKQGFIEIRAHSGWGDDWNRTRRIAESCVHPDGSRVYIKWAE